jgi:hypothetical protein
MRFEQSKLTDRQRPVHAAQTAMQVRQRPIDARQQHIEPVQPRQSGRQR